MNYIVPYGLKRARKAFGITQANLAKVLNVSLNTVRNWEQGRTTPDIDTLLTLCQMYGCDLDYLAGRNDCRTHDLQFIHNETGLTESAIIKLMEWNNDKYQSRYISSMVEHPRAEEYLESIHNGINDVIFWEDSIVTQGNSVLPSITAKMISSVRGMTAYNLAETGKAIIEELIDKEVRNSKEV